MNAMIDFCYVCIESQNVPQTLKILEEALNLLDVTLITTLQIIVYNIILGSIETNFGTRLDGYPKKG